MSAYPKLVRSGTVAVLHLGDDENRFTNDWILEVSTLLDAVVADPAPLVTVGDGPQYSSGLDLDWLQANPTRFQSYLSDVHHLLAKVLVLPVPTVAAINGHCFAAGAMLAMAHDRRVMREDRGWWCLPEVALGMPFTPGMDALLRHTLLPDVVRRAMVTGHRFTGPEALDARIVDELAADGEVLDRAVAMAEPLVGTTVEAVAQIKDRLHAEVVTSLHGD